MRVYVIWDPIFGGDFKGEAKKLANSFPDKRVTYYKDPHSLAGTLWKRVLKIATPIAWDVYFLYDGDAQWESKPPEPDFWMHQLVGVTVAPRLDQEEFTKELQIMLNGLELEDSRKGQQ